MLHEARTIILRPGFNLVAWTGGDVPLPEALGETLGRTKAVFTWDAAAQEFQSFRPELPFFRNTVTAVGPQNSDRE